MWVISNTKVNVTLLLIQERIINHLVNGTKLNNEKEKNSFQEDDYIVMASYLASSTDTYEKMTKIAPPVIEEKHEKIVRTLIPIYLCMCLFFHFIAARNL